jgi:hypothetical protein
VTKWKTLAVALGFAGYLASFVSLALVPTAIDNLGIKDISPTLATQSEN